METDFRAFFLLVEIIIEIPFSLHFSEAPVSCFPSVRKVFFNEILHSGWWKPFSFAQSFSSDWKPSLKLMEANF